MRRMLVACLLLVAAPLLAIADDPVFIRFTPGKAAGSGALQIAKTTYASDKTGVKVVLYGVVHIADAAYYASIQKDLDSYDAVLYEGVKPPEGVKPEESDGAGLGDLQKGMGELLGLTFQKDGINYQAKNLVHADMGWDELMKLAGGDLSKVLPGGGMFSPEMLKRLAPLMKVGFGFAKQMMDNNPSMRDSLKLQMAQQMIGQLDTAMPAEMQRVIVVERNKVALAVLDREVAARKDGTLAIFYGAAHNRDFHARLAERGYHLVSQDWKNAWTIGPFEAGAATPATPTIEPPTPAPALNPHKRYY